MTGLIPVSRLHNDLVDFGSNVFGQIIQQDVVDARRGIAGTEYGFPLEEARGRDFQFGACGRVDTGPGTPVAIGVVDVAAARIELDIGIRTGIGTAAAAHADASPERKNVRVEYVTLIRTFGLQAGAENKNLPQVAARRVKSSARCGRESGDLRGARFDQIGEVIDAVDGENVSAIARAGKEASMLIEGESVNEIVVGRPQTRWRAVGCDAIDL